MQQHKRKAASPFEDMRPHPLDIDKPALDFHSSVPVMLKCETGVSRSSLEARYCAATATGSG
jgi:hypothetical protein